MDGSIIQHLGPFDIIVQARDAIMIAYCSPFLLGWQHKSPPSQQCKYNSNFECEPDVVETAVVVIHQ